MCDYRGATGAPGAFVLELPAEAAALPAARAMAATAAMVRDVSLDDITDVRLATDEVCATLAPLAIDGSPLRCAVLIEQARIAITAQVHAAGPDGVPEPHSFGWQILNALAGSVETEVIACSSDERQVVLTIMLVVNRTTTG
jgi:serine/threonine-protein kinase RsbW